METGRGLCLAQRIHVCRAWDDPGHLPPSAAPVPQLHTRLPHVLLVPLAPSHSPLSRGHKCIPCGPNVCIPPNPDAETLLSPATGWEAGL